MIRGTGKMNVPQNPTVASSQVSFGEPETCAFNRGCLVARQLAASSRISDSPAGRQNAARRTLDRELLPRREYARRKQLGTATWVRTLIKQSKAAVLIDYRDNEVQRTNRRL